MGQSKQALVIAVPRYELEEAFPDLTSAVHRDAELLGEALHSSGYSVEVLGLAPDRPAQRSRIRSAVSRICCTAPQDGTVLIHFTGHGLSLGGADHLVPADAQLSWAVQPPEVAVDSLIDLDLTSLLAGCQAGTVLLTVDACRDRAGPDSASHGGPATNFPAWRDRVAVLFGCGPGQTCGADDEHGSHFTRALAEALDADTAPRTVAEVIAYTTTRTTELARAARHEQTPTPHYAPSGPDAIAPVLLCAGRTLQESWSTAVRDPELWTAVRCDDDRRARLQKALVELTRQCARWYTSSMAGVPDPWADDDYPVRVLTRGLRPLLAPSRTQGGPLLDAGEFAVLAAAPFVREALYALGVKAAVGADAFRLDPVPAGPGLRTERVDLEHTFAAHALIWRKGRELAARGRAEEAQAVAAWLLHRHVRGKEELWDEAYAGQLLTPLATALIGEDASARRVAELTDELVRICRQTGVVPARSYDEEREPPFRVAELVLAGPPGVSEVTETWRPRELSWLIAVAGLLGGDLRELPGVLVDNIGVADGLVPRRAVECVRELRWVRDRYTRAIDLDVACPHPAVHAGLEALTGWTDDAVLRIRQHLGRPAPDGLLAHLPERVTCGRLRPQYDVRTKGDAYGVPLMRFGLAEDEMRELLMGTQLYGDRKLALRELYQNALDACRYRQARLRYGKAGKGIPYSWRGEIVFRQGTDDEGRPYVDCEDNGVGMGRDTLRGTFSRAGRRFEQSREYRREQALWRRADENLRIYPNSRFGVGVFSYFMLADEIRISTRATDAYGRAESGRGLGVDIASSGSLFRIRPRDESQPGGGTTVRLYLQDDSVDVAKELAALVWRTDYTMRVERDGQTVRTWEPDTLYYEGDAGRAVRAARDLWWVPGDGRLLADGVLVGTPGEQAGELEFHLPPWPRGDDDREPHDSRRGRFPAGCVVDLRESHTPELSTSRTRVFSYDQEWVAREIIDACARFEAPQWFHLEWLWEFAWWVPEGAARITERLLAADARVTSVLAWDQRAPIPFRRVGYFPSDPALAIEHERSRPGYALADERYLAWRSGILRDAGIRRSERRRALPVPDSVEGYPRPRAWEARADHNNLDAGDFLLRAAMSPATEKHTFGSLLTRVRRHAVTGIDVPAVADLEAAHAMELDDIDRGLLNGRGGYGGLGPYWRLETEKSAVEDTVWLLERFSTWTGLPLREALGRMRRFAAAGFALRVPDTVAEPPADRPATAQELNALSWHPWCAGLDGRGRRGPRPDHRFYGEVLRRYAWLGLPELPALGEERQAVAEEDDKRRGLSGAEKDAYAEFFSPYVTDAQVSLVRVGIASEALSLTFAEVVERFAPQFEALGMKVPELGGLAGYMCSRLDCELLKPSRSRLDPLGVQAVPVPLVQTARAVHEVRTDPEQVRRALTRLAEGGLIHASAPGLLDRWREVSRQDLELLPGNPNVYGILQRTEGAGFDDVQEEFDAAYGLVAAALAEQPLGPTFDRLAVLGPLTGHEAPLRLPSPRLAGLRPSQADATACCLRGERGVVWRETPDVRPLIAHARDQDCTLGQSLDTLLPYAELGAPWQAPADTDDQTWRDHRPTVHDTALFKGDLVGSGRPVTPLDLVRAAARFGWPLDRAWDRLARYRPFGLELTMERPDMAMVPRWQDLILLTSHFTGRAPAVAGEITARHIAVAAREVEESTPWVRDRLALYAPLFGTTLPAHCPAEPAPTPRAERYVPATE
ncbi:caspase family protein [Streptomyces sp. NPDC023327]|uniref:HD domain-containing protein n=1 Tax=Streptomyces sp. NPDC023327 TaxID=3157088 RepID=UPI0033CDDDDD